MKIYRKLIPASLVFGAVVAQTPPARPEFEVVSVRLVEGLIAGRPAAARVRMPANSILLATVSNPSFRRRITSSHTR